MFAKGQTESAFLAQLDRALVYGTKGQGFESLRTHQNKMTELTSVILFCLSTVWCYICGMQKIKLVAVGSLKEKYWKDAASEYKKRLSRFCNLEIIEVAEKSNLAIDAKIEEESKLLAEKCKGKVLLFDRSGADTSSENLAALLKKYQTEPVLTFVIGGSNGVDQKLKQISNEKIKFGAATFPHQLFRVIALEQIYRAFSINADMPYHK